MHELSIAESVVQIASRHADGRQVIKVWMEEVPATGSCRDCGAESRLESFPLHCGACGGFDLELLGGEELFVESLELEEV
jgi:hydrogenase nickel incorporation protein HypA/HybF